MLETYKIKVKEHCNGKVLLETEHYFIFRINDTVVQIKLDDETRHEEVVGTIRYHLREKKDDVF